MDRLLFGLLELSTASRQSSRAISLALIDGSRVGDSGAGIGKHCAAILAGGNRLPTFLVAVPEDHASDTDE